MIQVGTYVKIVDKTGAVIGHVIKILGTMRKQKVANIGDRVLVSIIWQNIKHPKKHATKFKNRFKPGSLHKGLIVRAKTNKVVTAGAWIRYSENAICIVSNKGIPVSKRCHGPVSRKLCLRYPAIGCIARTVI